MKRILLVLLVVVPGVARADKNLTKGATWDCKKDATVNIGTGKGKYTFKGKCTTINVGGGMNTLAIESVDTLNVGGAKNKITVGTVDTINVGGADNTITWKTAMSGDAPTLNGQPDKNTITQAGAPATAKPAKTAGSTAAPAGAIDCAKSPTFSQNDNDGSFVFVGKCTKIAIAGNNNSVKAEDVNTVSLPGNNNSVEVSGAVAVIATPGNNNTVQYKKGVKAKISNPGTGNTITAK